MQIALLIVFYLLAPLFINLLCYKYDIVKKIGAVLLAYILGLILGNVGLFPEASLNLREMMANHDLKITGEYIQQLIANGQLTAEDAQYYQMYRLQDTFTTITIALALPLLLLSLNIRSWFRVAGKTFLSLFLGLISVIIPIVVGYILFHDKLEDSWKIAGMMTGVYSGGTPNLASIQKALDVNNLTYILTHTYDLVIGAVFLLFVISIGQRVLLRFLPAYKASESAKALEKDEIIRSNKGSFWKQINRKQIVPLLLALAVALIIIGAAVGIGELIPQEFQMMVIILTITSLSILASLIKRLNRIEKSFDVGMYFILVFSLVVASMADLRNFSSAHLHIFYWVLLVYSGSLFIHVLLAALFKVDADNVIIVSTALTCSPPFVPVVAGALKNREIIISGITVGIIGYAIGNYLGVSLAYLLKSFPF
jgi:uncharacterized membrane protein